MSVPEYLTAESAAQWVPQPAGLQSKLSVPPRIHKALLAQFLISILPLAPAFLLGHAQIGAVASEVAFGLLLLYHALYRRPFHFLCLLVSSLPLLVILRGAYMPFDIVVVIMSCGLSWAFLMPAQFGSFLKNKPLQIVMGVAVFFWLASFIITGIYSQNLRALEWAFCAGVVVMLSERRSYLWTALLGLGVAVIVSGLMLLPYGDRLGMGDIDGQTIGNPILLGLPAAFVILLSLAQRGRWLLLENHPWWRAALGAGCAIFLIFSTSRGSWVIAVAGIAVIAVVDRGARKPLIGLTLALAVIIAFLMGSPRMSSAAHYFDDVFTPGASLVKKTDGRAEQWAAFPAAFRDSPIWGFGPGTGRAICWAYTGENKQWHSLFLQIGAEMGLIGLVMLALMLGTMIRGGIRHFLKYKEIVPLLGTMSFILLALSVTGLDSLGGLFTGIGFIGTCSNLRIVHGGWFRITAGEAKPLSE